MAKIVSSYGSVENFTKSALLGLGATETDPNGRFYLDGNMVNAELSNVIAEAIYIQEIFRDGQSVYIITPIKIPRSDFSTGKMRERMMPIMPGTAIIMKNKKIT